MQLVTCSSARNQSSECALLTFSFSYNPGSLLGNGALHGGQVFPPQLAKSPTTGILKSSSLRI